MVAKVRILVSLILLIAVTSCSSKKTESDEIDTQAVDQELATIDGAATLDEENAGFADVDPGEALGEQPILDSEFSGIESFDSASGESGSVAYQVQGEAANFDKLDETSPSYVENDTFPPKNEVQKTKKRDRPTSKPSAVAASPKEKNISSKKPQSPKDVVLERLVQVPFQDRGYLLNGAYVVRPGDNWESLAEKLLGDKGAQRILRDMNPKLPKKLKVGQVIYYNSPVRPNDNQSVKLYYEDLNLSPQTYTASEDQDFKSIAKALLGFPEAWKEIWITHPQLDNQTTLLAGTTLRFWSNSNQPLLASNGMSPTAPPTTEPEGLPPATPPQQAMAGDPFDTGSDQFTDSRASAGTSGGEPDLVPPPPPPPPPVPPAVTNDSRTKSPYDDLPTETGVSQAGEEDHMMMILGGAGILVAGLAALILIRKRR